MLSHSGADLPVAFSLARRRCSGGEGMLSLSGADLPGVRGLSPLTPVKGLSFFWEGGVYANVPALAFPFLPLLSVVSRKGKAGKLAACAPEAL